MENISETKFVESRASRSCMPTEIETSFRIRALQETQGAQIQQINAFLNQVELHQGCFSDSCVVWAFLPRLALSGTPKGRTILSVGFGDSV